MPSYTKSFSVILYFFSNVLLTIYVFCSWKHLEWWFSRGHLVEDSTVKAIHPASGREVIFIRSSIWRSVVPLLPVFKIPWVVFSLFCTGCTCSYIIETEPGYFEKANFHNPRLEKKQWRCEECELAWLTIALALRLLGLRTLFPIVLGVPVRFVAHTLHLAHGLGSSHPFFVIYLAPFYIRALCMIRDAELSCLPVMLH